MKITLLDDYQDAVRKLKCFGLLAGHEVKIYNNTVKGLGQLSVRLADAEAIVLIQERTRISHELLGKLPKLRFISHVGKIDTVPCDYIDLAACAAREVLVSHTPGDATATGELTWALIMAAAKRIPQYTANLKHGVWQQSGMKSANSPPNYGLGVQLRGKTLGILGYEASGSLVAGYGKAFGMQVLVWGDAEERARAVHQGYGVATNRAALFSTADVLSLHLSNTLANRGSVQLSELQSMKPTALLVNARHADLMASEALLKALHTGRPGMAAIDVFESEPILAGQPLLRMENVICTPHIGYVEVSAYENEFDAAFRNILDYAAGTPRNLVTA